MHTLTSPGLKGLISAYQKKKPYIKKRLKEFETPHKKDEDLFAELCFCILTPQSKAVNCDKAIKELKRSDLLSRGSAKRIGTKLKGLARFHNKKADYIIAARKVFKKNKKFEIKEKLDQKDILKTRQWLVKNIKGLGYKEASHFLRNTGLGKDISILDVHIMRNLKRFGVIKNIPSSLTEKNYLMVESRMREFSRRTKIPIAEMDLLFWSNETGFIFK